MNVISDLYRSALGKKAVMAATGLVLFGFVLTHMAGNLKVFQGPEKFNAYAEGLRELGAPFLPHGGLLWIARFALLAAVGLHIHSAWAVSRQSRAARPVGYQRLDLQKATYASRTMRWGGVIIALFVLYHLAHLTWGSAHPDFVPGDVYHNFVTGFSVWWVSAFYVVANVALAFHLYHGLWSLLQSLGLNHPAVAPWRRPLAATFAAVVFAGNVALALSVVLGIVH